MVTEQPARARDRGDLADGAQRAVGSARLQASPAGTVLSNIAWAAAYAVASWLGHVTVFEESGFALFWPASGVALLWVTTSPARTRPLAFALIGLVAAGSAQLTDGSAWHVVNAAVGVPLGLAVFLTLARRWAPELWARERDLATIETLRTYGILVLATTAAGLTEGVVAAALLGPAPGTPFEQAGELAVTHTVAMVAVGLTGLIFIGWLATTPPGPFFRRVVDGVRRDSTREDLMLGLAALLLAVLTFLAGFVWFTDAPVSFVLVMGVVAVAVRFGPVATGVYALGVLAATCWFTAEGNGPIADIPEIHRRALAFGLFATATVVTGIIIALSRRERDATIAQLKESEAAAEVLADDLSLVLANLEEGVAVVEEGGRFIHANAAIGRLLEMPDFDDAQVQPVETYHLTHPDGRPLLESEVPHARAFAGEENVHDILHLSRPDVPGHRIYEVASRLLPQIRSTDKRRAVTTIRDVTAEQEHRDALASFAHVVAHDLRSPLTSVELWARELLESYEEGPVDHETGAMMARHIDSAASRMQNFISDLLAYALARDQTPSPAQVELVDVVESVVETIAAVEGASPRVTFDDLPGVWCDPVLMPQLFDNLIGNSRKYVADGVEPEVRIEATRQPDDWARIRVIDNGVGIAVEDRVRVFGTFERARASEYEGTGLGLAICRHIVERHGGTIAVTTPPPGFSTCIELTLPLTDEAFERGTAGTRS